MRISPQGPLDSEDQLPELEYGRHSADVGKTWWIGIVWHVWDGVRWQKAIATKTAPKVAA
jgi:hypothetical protein